MVRTPARESAAHFFGAAFFVLVGATRSRWTHGFKRISPLPKLKIRASTRAFEKLLFAFRLLLFLVL